MTETTQAVAPETGDGRNKKTLVIAGGVAGALVLGGAGYVLMSGGSSSDEAFTPPVHRVVKSAPAPKSAPVRKTAASVVKVPATSSVKIGRDPFSALYIQPEAPVKTDTTSAGSPSAGDTTTAPAAGAPYTIVLTKITSDPGGAKLFTFKIGAVTKTVIPAQRFGNYGELVVLTYIVNSKKVPVAAVLQVGDDNPIEVPIGVKTSVQ